MSLRFFNARAAADHIVYALDQSASVIIAENMRGKKRESAADKVDVWTRVVFVGAVLCLFVVGFFELRTP